MAASDRTNLRIRFGIRDILWFVSLFCVLLVGVLNHRRHAEINSEQQHISLLEQRLAAQHLRVIVETKDYSLATWCGMNLAKVDGNIASFIGVTPQTSGPLVDEHGVRYAFLVYVAEADHSISTKRLKKWIQQTPNILLEKTPQGSPIKIYSEKNNN